MAQKLEWEMFWMQFGTCKQGPIEDMFPSDGAGVAKAKRVCNAGNDGQPCPVRKACLMYALEEGMDHGVWGGTSERQRRKMRAEAARQEPEPPELEG